MLLHRSSFQCLDLLTYVSTDYFRYTPTVDYLFTVLISSSSMRFLLLLWLRSEGSQCHREWVPNLTSGFPAHLLQGSTGIPLLLSFCCWVCISSFFFFFFLNCDSNYFKHNYILQRFESAKCCAQDWNSQLVPSEAKCQQAFEEAVDCPRQLGEEQWVTAATTLGWHRAQVLLRGVSPVEWSR